MIKLMKNIFALTLLGTAFFPGQSLAKDKLNEFFADDLATSYEVDSEVLDECSICFGSIEGSAKTGSSTCSHLFHKGCIEAWMARDSSARCPNCREETPTGKRRSSVTVVSPASSLWRASSTPLAGEEVRGGSGSPTKKMIVKRSEIATVTAALESVHEEAAICDFLVKKFSGLDPMFLLNWKDHDACENDTILHVAVRHTNQHAIAWILGFLISEGIDPDLLLQATNGDGQNPFHIAAINEDFETIKTLVAYASSDEQLGRILEQNDWTGRSVTAYAQRGSKEFKRSFKALTFVSPDSRK